MCAVPGDVIPLTQHRQGFLVSSSDSIAEGYSPECVLAPPQGQEDILSLGSQASQHMGEGVPDHLTGSPWDPAAAVESPLP